MITDAETLANLRSQWQGVVRMLDRMKLLCVATFAYGSFTAPALAKVLYNLPLLLAFDVLRQVLIAARDEGVFSCRGSTLGSLMDGGQAAIPWIDWDELRAGVKRRNNVAHDGELFEGGQCLQDIGNVEKQLAAWGIIAA
jgi:hypothetical protein